MASSEILSCCLISILDCILGLNLAASTPETEPLQNTIDLTGVITLFSNKN